MESTNRPANESEQRKLTLGEFRVGISFNPGGHEKVNSIKRKAADLIDELEGYRSKGQLPINNENEHERLVYNEVNRLISLAQTHIEDAAMWAVKAVTKQ